MKLKHLEAALQNVNSFDKPKVHLEQYATPAHLAACLLHCADEQFGDIEGCEVLDIGCGCGILSIGASILGASYTVGVDIDEDALQLFAENCEEMETTDNVDCILADVTKLHHNCLFKRKFDTVVMNPPYGTKNNKGIDIEFLRAASKLTSNAIYSLHKKATRDFVCKKAITLGLKPNVVAELRYNLAATYRFHKEKSKDIEVDFIRFTIDH